MSMVLKRRDLYNKAIRKTEETEEKRMKRRTVAAILCMAMTATLFTGCGSGAKEEGTESKDNKGADEEITEIIWQYPTTLDADSEGFINMENALNEMMEKDIGVHVTFEPVNLMESQNDAILKVSSGEQLDIMLTAFTSIGNVVSKGLINPLDDLLDEYGQDILEHSHTKEMCGYDGQTYGVCTGDTIGNEFGYLIKKEYWEKYNLAEVTGWTEEKVYTTDELEEIFEIVKAGEGENFYCDVPWNTTPEPMNNGYMEYDKIGGSLATGVLMLNRSFDDLTVYDLFETEEYKEYCEMRYDWAQKGYIAPDAAVTTEAPNSILAQKNYLGVCAWGNPQDMIQYNPEIGCEMVCLDMVPRYAAYNGGSVIQWSIPITSANPEKAMQAINYIYQNPEAAWLIQFGIEGSEYEVVEEQGDLKQIRYLDDVSALKYYMPYGIWGNILQWPAVAPSPIDYGARKQALDDAIPEERKSPAFGYSFNQEPVSTEIAAVNTVIEQYTPSLNCGAINPDEALPEFISALKAAGMDKIIAEQQKQLDEWAASK